MNVAARRLAAGPGMRLLLNLAVFQAAWFACVGFAADGDATFGIAAVAAAVLLHLALSDRPGTDLLLALVAIATGAVWDTFAIHAGWIAYASPGSHPGFAPAWILALWALFATTLREPLKWMHSRPVVAALFGAIGGPVSYAAAARMGACTFADPVVSMLALGAGWAVMTPMLVALARRVAR